MIELTQIKLPINHTERELRERIRKLLRTDRHFTYTVERRSLDARKKPNLFFVYSVNVQIDKERDVIKHSDKSAKLHMVKEYEFPYRITDISENERPVIIGFGPCGMFAGLYLARNGFKPIIFEKGQCIEKRTESVRKFWEEGVLNPDSNVQFGEGGAGAFSDGKLNTLVKDESGRNKAVLRDFVNAGASKDVEFDYKPHVGTDKLVEVVRNIRDEILNLGGEIHFDSEISDFQIENGRLRSISTKDGAISLSGRRVILAVGHSARETFAKLYLCDVPMKPKSFAVGLRVAHPVELINKSQYGFENSEILGNANYKLTNTCQDGRGVYSFCMCPGGYVVNASSENGCVCVNGMSYSKRDADYSNSAVIVTIDPEDYGNLEPLSGIEFQRKIERKAYEIGMGKIPVEYFSEFKNESLSEEFEMPTDCIKGQAVHASVHEILPQFINSDIVEGIESFGTKIQGFDSDKALLMGVESRTSSPVRIMRNQEGESFVKNLFPAGEGAGFAGGITSAAMDGIFEAENVARSILKNQYRKSVLKKRDELTTEKRNQKARAIFENLEKIDKFLSAKNVLVYYNFKSEVPTLQFIDEMILTGKNVYIPKVFEDRMEFFRIDSSTVVEPGAFGINEPIDCSESKRYYGEEATVVLAPGAVFDQNGKRIGYGGGFYDRFFASHPEVCSIGLSFELQVEKSIEITSKSDFSMDYVVTEERVYSKNE